MPTPPPLLTPSGRPSGGNPPRGVSTSTTRRPDIVTIGGSVRLVSVDLLAAEFGVTRGVARTTLSHMGVPVVDIGGREFLQLVEVEKALILRTVNGVDTPDDLITYMEWAATYHGAARRRAILESLQAVRPAWDKLRRRVRKHGYAGAIGPS